MPAPQRRHQRPQPQVARPRHQAQDRLLRLPAPRVPVGLRTFDLRPSTFDPLRCLPAQVGRPALQRAHRLLQRRLEGAVDRHHLAGRLHLRPERAVGRGELVERPAWDLHDDVVQSGLESGRRLLGDGVGDLVEPFADRDLRRDASDRIARRLRCERRRPRDPRVHLDDVVRDQRLRVSDGRAVGIERELDVAAAFDAERANDAKRRASEHLVFLVGQRL